MKYRNTYLAWIDLVKILAMFGVVLLHVAAPLTYKYGKIPNSYWWTANIYDSIVRVCVPLFFMVSGKLLLGKIEKIPIFLYKRVKKVVIPLIAWSIIYIVWRGYVIDNIGVSSLQILSLLIYPASIHLWFLYAIIGIYLYVPLLRIIIQNANTHHLYYFIALWLLAVSLIPYIEKLLKHESYFDFMMISGYGGYFALGYLLDQIKLNNKKIFYFQITILTAMIAATAFLTFYLNKDKEIFDDFFYRYLNINIVLQSASAFLVLKYLFNKLLLIKSSSTLKIIKSLSSASLGIYLIHPIILYYLENNYFGFSLSTCFSNPILYIPYAAIVTFLLSFLVIVVLQKIVILKNIVP